MSQRKVFKLMIILSYLTLIASKETRPLIGSVVNYVPIWDQNKPYNVNILKNAENYCKLITDASKLSADIIVFPAEGLTGAKPVKKSPITLPSIAEKYNPSKHNYSNEVLSLISRCTKSRNIYSVLTVNEMLNDQICLTQIVLDRNGTLIARNREVRCRNSSKIEEEIFVTDKGHRIGLMLNGDLFVQKRTNQMKKMQIMYFALSYDLIESLPFSTGIQTEWWWSYRQNRPLLAAGLGVSGRSGSGLYTGRRLGLPKEKDGNKQMKGTLLVYTVPNITDSPATGDDSYSWSDTTMLRIHRMKELIKEENRTRRSSSTAYATAEAYVSVEKRDLDETRLRDNINRYSTRPVSVNFKTIHSKVVTFLTDETLCQDELCCRFQMKWKLSKNKHEGKGLNYNQTHGIEHKRNCYLLVVGSLEEDLGGEGSGHVQRCALVYSKSRSECRYSTLTTKPNSSNRSTNLPIIYYQLLDRTNAVLDKVEITANQQNLTPNILLENELPNTNSIQFSNSPVSRLFVNKTPVKFETIALQQINNFIPY